MNHPTLPSRFIPLETSLKRLSHDFPKTWSSVYLCFLIYVCDSIHSSGNAEEMSILLSCLDESEKLKSTSPTTPMSTHINTLHQVTVTLFKSLENALEEESALPPITSIEDCINLLKIDTHFNEEKNQLLSMSKWLKYKFIEIKKKKTNILTEPNVDSKSNESTDVVTPKVDTETNVRNEYIGIVPITNIPKASPNTKQNLNFTSPQNAILFAKTTTEVNKLIKECSSALNFEDVETAKNRLKRALELLDQL